MKIVAARLNHETNTFSPVPTPLESFGPDGPKFGPAAFDSARGTLTGLGAFIAAAESRGDRITVALNATANPSGRVDDAAYERFAETICAAVREGCDAILLDLHGAMVTRSIDDGEGELLRRVRAIAPETPLAVALDLHGNITQTMIDNADVLVGFKTYPHIDMFETGVKAARLMLRMLKGRWRPVKAFRKLPLIVAPENCSTSRGMMHRLMQQAEALEKSGQAAAVSIFPVQPWLDIEEMGCSIVVAGNGDAHAAERDATRLARCFWDNRRAFDVQLTPVEEAVAAALRTRGGPVVLAESSDSTGSGSPGDSTGVLKVLLKAPLDGPARAGASGVIRPQVRLSAEDEEQ